MRRDALWAEESESARGWLQRHVLHDLDSRLIVAVGVTPANAPEASVTDAIEQGEFHADFCVTLRGSHCDSAPLE